MNNNELGDLYVEFDRAYYSQEFWKAIRINQMIYTETQNRLSKTENKFIRKIEADELKNRISINQYLTKWILLNILPHNDN